MSKREKVSRQRNAARLFEVAKRELAKGDTKNALRNAKVCYRDWPDQEVKQFLEKAHVGRIEQLHQRGLAAESKAVMAELLALEPTNREVISKLPALRLAVGDCSVNAQEILEKDPTLLIRFADQSVLDDRQTPPAYAGLRAQVAAVRDALAGVERGDDTTAAKQLEAIPRNSPLADWKLFVRGLSGFYQSDRQRWQANWERLDSARPAARIAQTLLAAAGESLPPNLTADVAARVERLRVHLAPPGLMQALQELKELWLGPEGEPFFRRYRDLVRQFLATHPAVIERVVELVGQRSILDADPFTMEELISIGPPLKLDPRWNRLRAMVAERNPDSDRHEVKRYWNNYVSDLRNRVPLRDEERPIAAGIVLLRLARYFRRQLEKLERKSLHRHRVEAAMESLAADVVWAYQECLRAAPRIEAGYREWADFEEQQERAEEAAAVRLRLVAEFPDDFEAHYSLGCFFLQENAPEKAEPHVAALFRLSPRDPRCGVLRWQQQLAEVRKLAKGKKFDRARETLIAAVREATVDIPPFALAENLAAIAYRAKDFATAEKHVAEALEQAPDPIVIWVTMSYVSSGFGLSREVKKNYDDRYKAAVARTPTSEASAALARHFHSLAKNKLNYVGRATHQRLFLASLLKALYQGWRECDLVDLGRFLQNTRCDWRIWTSFVDMARSQFPRSAFFAMWGGLKAMEAGPRHLFELNRAAEDFGRALELAPTTAGFSSADCDFARQQLSQIADLRGEYERPFGFGGGGDDDAFDDDDDFEDYDDDGEEDDSSPFDFEDSGSFNPFRAMGPMPPLPGSPGAGSRSQSMPDKQSIPDKMIEKLIQIMESMMPAEARRDAERVAKESGKSLHEVLRMIICESLPRPK